MYADGMSTVEIARIFNKEGIKSPSQVWHGSVQLSEAEDKVRELNRMKVHECFAVTKLTEELLDEYVESVEVHLGNEVRISWK